MGLTVKIRSKDMIKPSSPTPNRFKTYRFSFIDQSAVPTHMPLIFFYQSQVNHSKNSSILLKQALSETLVDFYPFAGRIDLGKSSISCDDQGVEYYEADVLANLSEFVESPDLDELMKLLPFPPVCPASESMVAGVQVNHFSCGGVAICVSTSHKLADAATQVALVNAWATTSRLGGAGAPRTDPPKFDAASVFPPLDNVEVIPIGKEKIVTKRLIFDNEKIDALKKLAAADSARCSRTEVLTALLWMLFIKGARAKTNPPQTFLVLQAVNLRNVKSIPVPKNSYGNLCWITVADAPVAATAAEAVIEFRDMVGKLRDAVKKIHSTDMLQKLRTGECVSDLHNTYKNSIDGKLEYCGVTSVLRLPVYEADFGWGKPVWVSSAPLPLKNFVVLFQTKCGQGIEVWMFMAEDDIFMLDLDNEFVSLTSPKLEARL